MLNSLDKKEILCKINRRLQDEESKQIFCNRLMYSLTKDKQYIINILKYCENTKYFVQKLQESRQVILYDYTLRGEKLVTFFDEVSWVGYSGRGEKKYLNLERINAVDIKNKYPDALIILTMSNDAETVKNWLIGLGINEESIIDYAEYIRSLQKAQYFDLPQLHLTKDEVFVDCGAYDMGTTDNIIKKCSKVYAFEPDNKNFQLCLGRYEKDIKSGKVIISHAGTYSKTTKLKFLGNKKGSSLICENGDMIINTVALDDVIDEKVTFIKLDVEGSELATLNGAKELIKKYKPKLAVSVYHKPEDIIDLPLYIMELNPDYKFYLRHYKIGRQETVLYAITQ